MDSPFQEVPGTPLLDRIRSFSSSQSPAAVVPAGIRDRSTVSEPSRSVSRFVRTPRSVASPFVVPNGTSPLTPRQMVESTPRSLIVSSAIRETPNIGLQGNALNRTSRRRQTHDPPRQEILSTPMRQRHHAIPRQLLRSAGNASKLSEQVVPSTPKQQTDHVPSIPRSRSEPASKKTASTMSTVKRNTQNVEMHHGNVIKMDATGDHYVGSSMKQNDKKTTKVSRQRRILIPREKSNNTASSDILDHIE